MDDEQRDAPRGAAAVHPLVAGIDLRSVVLVEGVSDQLALEALAERRGRNLDAEGVSVVAMGGATTIGRFLDLFGPQGELGSFRTLQKQPAQRGRSTEQQLRRFMGTRGGRKIRYARLLVDALDLSRVPRPLDGVLAHV